MFKQTYFENLNEILNTSAPQPTVFMANQYGSPMTSIRMINNCKLQLSFLDKDTLSFSVPEQYFDIYSGEYVKADNFGDILKYKILYTNGLGQYIITEVNENNDGLSRTKDVTAYSYEYTLSYKPADIFSAESSEEGKMELKLYEIMNACKIQNGWNYVLSNNIKNLQRTFDNEITENWWDFLTSTVSDVFNCFFIFDNETRTIYGYSQEEFENGYNSNLIFTHDCILNNTKLSEISDNVTTVLKVEGTDFDISEVNPLGSYIYNFDYFMNTKWMPQGLTDKIKAWQEKVNSLRPMYADLMMVKNKLISMANECLANASIQRAEKKAAKDRMDSIIDAESVHTVSFEGHKPITYLGMYYSTWRYYHEYERMYDVEDDNAVSCNHKDIMDMIEIIDKRTASAPSESAGWQYHPIQEEILVLPTRVWEMNISNPNLSNNQIRYITDTKFNEETGRYERKWYIDPAYTIEGVTTHAYGYYPHLYTPDNLTGENASKLQRHLINANNITTRNENGVRTAKGNIYSLPDIRHMCALEQNFTSDEISALKRYMIYDTYSNNDYAQEDLTNDGGILPTRKRDMANELYSLGVTELRKRSQPKYTYEIDVNNFLSLKEYQDFCKKLSMGYSIKIEMPDSKIATPSLGTCSIEFDNIDTLSLQFVNSRDVKTNEMTFKDLFRNIK